MQPSYAHLQFVARSRERKLIASSSHTHTKAIIVAHVLMVLLEEFPLWNVLLGLAAHVVYLTLLKRFPVIEASDPKFILSCGTRFA
mgnify:CR=1 FL=1